MPKRKKLHRHLDSFRGTVARRSRSQGAIRQRNRRKQELWWSNMDYFESMLDSLRNPKGRARTVEENKLILLHLFATARRHLSTQHIKDVSWWLVETEVAEDLKVGHQYVSILRQTFLGEDEEDFPDSQDVGSDEPYTLQV